jgi:hypothetical protein
MIETADDRVEMISESRPKARKEHICSECRRTIQKGESYTVEVYHFDGDFTTHKTCRHCMVVRDWLARECGGWLFGGVAEDIQEHVEHNWYGFAVKKLAIGIWRKWQRKDGHLWPIPALPKAA